MAPLDLFSQEQEPSKNALPLESGVKPAGGSGSVAAPASGAAPGTAGSAPTGGSSPADGSAEPAAPAPFGDAAPAEAAAGESEEAAPPPMASVNKDAINKLLENRLDIGAYRVQIAANDDFSDGQVLFDKTYDVMEDINLFDEFKAAGVNIDRSAYWVRIAFIDLLQMELPWTQPRLYGLDKKRVDSR